MLNNIAKSVPEGFPLKNLLRQWGVLFSPYIHFYRDMLLYKKIMRDSMRFFDDAWHHIFQSLRSNLERGNSRQGADTQGQQPLEE